MTAITNIHWASNTSGDFDTAGNWTPADVPSADFDVYLDTLSAPYTVTSSVSNNIDFFQVEAGVTFDIAGGTFRVANVNQTYSTLYNLGSINISSGAVLALGISSSPAHYTSELFNNGSVSIVSGGKLKFSAPWNQLLGSGKLTISGTAQIVAGVTSATFDNNGSKIVGGGLIGNSTLTFQNTLSGVVKANATTALTINTGANSIWNTGTISSTGAGGLVVDSPMDNEGYLIANGSGPITLNSSTVSGSGDAETISSGASILLNNSAITLGGIISTVAGSSISALAGTTDAISTAEFKNAGTLSVGSGALLSLNATIYNTGAIDLNGIPSGPATELQIYNNGAAFFGTGTIVLSDSASNEIVSAGTAVQLNNSSTISGAGTIGDVNLRFVNLAGVVDANDDVALNIIGDSNSNESSDYNNGLIETTGSGGLNVSGLWSNAGTFDAAGSGALNLSNAVISGGGGVIEASAGGTIDLNGTTLTNGSYLTVAATGAVVSYGSDTIGENVFNAGTFNVENGTNVVLSNHFNNTGTLDIDAGSVVQISSTGSAFRFVGGGTVNFNGATIKSAPSGGDFRNVDNTIVGFGQIGDANLTVENSVDGTINATGNLTFNTGANTITNSGVIASNGASGSEVTFDSGAYVNGTVVSNSGNVDFAANVFGGGAADINGSGTVEFSSSSYISTVFESASTGTLQLDSSTTNSYLSGIWGFTASDAIDLRDIAYSATNTSVSTNMGLLDGEFTVSNSATAQTSTVYMVGDYQAFSFQTASDGHGGTLVY